MYCIGIVSSAACLFVIHLHQLCDLVSSPLIYVSDAEEQAVAVAFSGADDASITDCEFHIKEAVVSSSLAVQCEQNSKL